MNRTERRISKLQEIKEHTWYQRLYDKLKADEKKSIDQYILNYGECDENEWAMKVQRAFLNEIELKKTKNWTTVNEILLVCRAD